MNATVLKLPPHDSRAVGDAFGALAANLRLSGAARILTVTSCREAEESAVIVLEVAKALAAGRRVLVIDADLRTSPISAKYTRQAIAVGLADLLAGNAEPTEVIRPTDIEGLELVVAGAPASDPAALLESTAFDDYLELLDGEYDHILINTPPILHSNDATLVAAASDASALTVRCWSVSRRDLLSAKAQLEKSGRPILGTIVINRPTGKRKRRSRLLSRISPFAKK